MTDLPEETTPDRTSTRKRQPRVPPLDNLLAVAAGGAVGTGLRYAFVLAFPTDPGRFPLTTFAENVLGAFLLGMVLTGLLRASRPRRDWRPFLATGVLGSFTTFSNFSIELLLLGTGGHAAVAIAYAAASVAAGLAAAAAGITAGTHVLGRNR